MEIQFQYAIKFLALPIIAHTKEGILPCNWNAIQATWFVFFQIELRHRSKKNHTLKTSYLSISMPFMHLQYHQYFI